MMKKFKLGDKVRLISGSSIMTVIGYQNYLNMNSQTENIESDTDVKCEYYNDHDNLFVNKIFHQDTLEKVD